MNSSPVLLPTAVDVVEPTAGIIEARTTCVSCSEERDAHEVVGGRCLDCRLGEKLRPRFERLAYLMRKQRHIHDKLGRRGHQGIDDQVGRELRRIWADISGMVLQRARRHEYLNKFLAQVQEVTGLSHAEIEAAASK